MSTKTPIRAGDFIVFCWEMLDGARTCIPHPPHPSQPDPPCTTSQCSCTRVAVSAEVKISVPFPWQRVPPQTSSH